MSHLTKMEFSVRTYRRLQWLAWALMLLLAVFGVVLLVLFRTWIDTKSEPVLTPMIIDFLIAFALSVALMEVQSKKREWFDLRAMIEELMTSLATAEGNFPSVFNELWFGTLPFIKASRRSDYAWIVRLLGPHDNTLYELKVMKYVILAGENSDDALPYNEQTLLMLQEAIRLIQAENSTSETFRQEDDRQWMWPLFPNSDGQPYPGAPVIPADIVDYGSPKQ